MVTFFKIVGIIFMILIGIGVIVGGIRNIIDEWNDDQGIPIDM